MQAQGLFDVPDKRGKYGLVQNIGLGGAVVCSLLRRPEFYKPGGHDGRDRCVFAKGSEPYFYSRSQARLQSRLRMSVCHSGRCREGEVEEEEFPLYLSTSPALIGTRMYGTDFISLLGY